MCQQTLQHQLLEYLPRLNCSLGTSPNPARSSRGCQRRPLQTRANANDTSAILLLRVESSSQQLINPAPTNCCLHTLRRLCRLPDWLPNFLVISFVNSQNSSFLNLRGSEKLLHRLHDQWAPWHLNRSSLESQIAELDGRNGDVRGLQLDAPDSAGSGLKIEDKLHTHSAKTFMAQGHYTVLTRK